MLKPSDLQNCEKDEDQLLVSILQRSSEALQGQKVNAKKASAATMKVLTKMIGAGFQDEHWASEGEEVAEEDAVNISLARSELEIMDALGGYVMTRLSRQKKLSCDRCRSELVTSEQGILLQERQRDGKQLLSASRSLKTFFSTQKLCFVQPWPMILFALKSRLG